MISAQVEEDLLAMCRSGRHRDAATRALESLGPEIVSYLYAVLRDETEVGEAFSIFCARLWQALPSFRGDSSFRTFAYVLARRSLADVARERASLRRLVPLSSAAEQLAARVRSETLEYLRTALKDRVAELRAELSPDEQQLLILRVNRKLSWPDIARVFLDEDRASEAEIARTAATLRKRFERVKDTLRRRVRS